MEWTVVTALVVLVGLFLTVGRPILQLNQAITKLQISVDRLESYQNKQDDRLDAHSQKLDDHERRITTLEIKQEEK